VSAVSTGADANDPLAPEVEDLGCYILGGRVTDASLGITQAVEAERLGFRRVWLSERFSLKECGVLFGGIAASTARIGVGTGATPLMARLPIVTAAMGATLHSAFGPRCTIGLGLGAKEFNVPHGMPVANYAALTDYADIVKRLWAGERVDYDGPAGSFHGLAFPDTYPGPPPQIWHVQLGGPKACAVSAHPGFDGVMLGIGMTPSATARAVEQIHAACRRIGRDPASLRICVPVHSAPDVPPGTEIINPSYGGVISFDTLKAFYALFVTQPSLMNGIIRRNGWNIAVAEAILAHPMFAGGADDADNRLRNRAAIEEIAALVPDQWVEESCAVGPVGMCVRKLQEFRDAGADEIATYTSAPMQNAELIEAWRAR
jgi:5,10-methylenetetrahydromethanopterin reductase